MVVAPEFILGRPVASFDPPSPFSPSDVDPCRHDSNNKSREKLTDKHQNQTCTEQGPPSDAESDPDPPHMALHLAFHKDRSYRFADPEIERPLGLLTVSSGFLALMVAVLYT